MATTTQNDNRAKFLELRSQGKSVADARNATYGPPPVVADATPTTPVAPAPVAPVTPTQPTTPAPIVNAPVDKTTGLSTPLAPAVQPTAPVATTPVTPTTPKVDATPGITQDSFNQAKAESEKIKAQNEAQMALNKQQSELRQTEKAKANEAKTAEAKQVQDQANTQLANNEGAILNTLKVGGIIPEQVKSSPYYKTALATYNKMQQYSTYSIGQLTTALNQGNILPGTSLYNEMMKDPALKTKLTEAQIYTSSKPTDKTAMYENASTDILSSNPKTANMLADGVITVDEYNQATNNDAIMAKAKEREEKTNKYNALYAEYEAIPEKIRADFPGSPFADAMIADAQNAKYKAVILARGEMNSADGTLIELKAQASSLFETNLKLYQDQQIEANKIKAEQRATQNALALSQAQFDQKLAQQTQLTNDPTTAIGGVIKQFSDLGIVGDRDLAWHVAEQKRLGMTLPEYTKKMIEDFKAKPEYQQALAKKANEGVSFQTIGDKVYKVQNGQLVDTGISATKTPEAKAPEWKQDASGNWYNANSATSPGSQVSTGSKATGNIVPVTAGNKTVRLDQVGAGGFENAMNQLKSAGLSVVVGEGARDQTATIQSMANRYGITFNASNPAETAQKLRSAGHQVADPGKSNHESGMAIDVYGSSKLDKVTPAQEKILNANGWYSAGIPGDAGHFEYRGGTTGTETSQIEKDATLERIRRGQVTDSELGKIQQKAIAGGWGTDFTEALKKGMKTTLTDTQIKGLATVDDKIQKDTVLDNVNLVSQQKETIKGLLNTDINANGFNDIALINAFQKIVDPGVSVKEGDVALLQSGIALKDKLNPNNMLASVSAGTKLTPETRKQMLDSTVAIYNAQADFGNDLMKKKYYKLADNYGINLADYGYSYDKIDSKGKTIKPISEILPGTTGFKSFMSELSNLINQ